MRELFDHYSEKTLTRFKKFHKENPEVYELFKELAFKMKATGKKKYSARTIFEVMRWDYDLRTSGEVFELNNDFTSIYARLLVFHYPEMNGFFELRVEKNKGIKSLEQQRREQHVHRS